MIIFVRAKVEQDTINEAEVGRFEYGGMEGTTLILDGELLVPIDEVKQLDKEFGVEKPDLPVDEPFQKWEDLIAAVAQRTPEAKKIRRYLEDFGYQDILKMSPHEPEAEKGIKNLDALGAIKRNFGQAT